MTDPQPSRRRWRRRTPAEFLHRRAGPGAAIFALVILIAGILVGNYIRIMPVAGSDEAGQVDRLFNTMLGISASIFLLVEGVLVYSAFRFRRKKGDEGDGLPLYGSNRLEIAWTLVPTLIVLWLSVYSLQIFNIIRTSSPGAMTVEVVGRQFQWEFHYPEADVTSSDLHLPLDRPVLLRITAADVLHSLWVPAFRIKQDAIPGRETELRFTPDAPGMYPVACAELCGVGHGHMGFGHHVVVESPADFDKWLAQEAAHPTDPRARVFTNFGCQGCHTLTAVSVTGNVGPNLDGIGTRAGTRKPGFSAEEYIRESILMPDAFIAPECPTGACPGGVMPKDFGVRIPPPELDALVSFLLEQR